MKRDIKIENLLEALEFAANTLNECREFIVYIHEETPGRDEILEQIAKAEVEIDDIFKRGIS